MAQAKGDTGEDVKDWCDIGLLEAAFKSSTKGKMEATLSDVQKIIKDDKLFHDQVQNIFSKYKTGNKMSFNVFKSKKWFLHMHKQDATAAEKHAKKIAASGETKGAECKDVKAPSKKANDVTSRLTDTKNYKGTHKHRFDASGQGKGIEGRETRADGSGYVVGYKNKDTYGT